MKFYKMKSRVNISHGEYMKSQFFIVKNFLHYQKKKKSYIVTIGGACCHILWDKSQWEHAVYWHWYKKTYDINTENQPIFNNIIFKMYYRLFSVSKHLPHVTTSPGPPSVV